MAEREPTPPTGSAHQIVIVGGGAGGLELATRLGDTLGHAPHITLSYNPPHPLQRIDIDTVTWPVDEILLVIGGGATGPYRYRVVERWPLQPAGLARGAQSALF